jgi:hypothetical protein
MGVHREAERVVVEAFDQAAQALPLSSVLRDVRAILRHGARRIASQVIFEGRRH